MQVGERGNAVGSCRRRRWPRWGPARVESGRTKVRHALLRRGAPFGARRNGGAAAARVTAARTRLLGVVESRGTSLRGGARAFSPQTLPRTSAGLRVATRGPGGLRLVASVGHLAGVTRALPLWGRYVPDFGEEDGPGSHRCVSATEWLPAFRPSRSGRVGSEGIATWLILPVVICLSQRLSHACLSINNFIL